MIYFSLKVIIHPDTMFNKVHFHIWNFPPAYQGTVQGSVYRVDNSTVHHSIEECSTVQRQNWQQFRFAN